MAFRAPNRVLESTTTEGTGPLTLVAVEGYKRLSEGEGIVLGDAVHYLVEAVNAVGKPTGAWEAGRGTYSAINEITRTTPIESSNNDAAVNFGPGSKRVSVTILAPLTSAQIAADWREMLDLGKSAVLIDSATGGALIPVGTTAQRGAPTTRKVRINSTTGKLEYSDGTRWNQLGGATGGGNDQIFYLNGTVITEPFVIPANTNAVSVGPLEIANGVDIEISDGSSWSIV